MTPYNTGKVLIGSRYVPQHRPPVFDAYDTLWQRVLTNRRQTLRERICAKKK